MAMDLRGYLAYRCFQMLRMEHDLRYLYDLLWKEVQNFDLKEFLQQQSQATEEQTRNLEEVLRRLGESVELPVTQMRARALAAAPETLALMAEQGGHPLTQGIIQEHLMFMHMNPPQEAIEIHDLLEAERVDHLEVIDYEGLISLAEGMALSEVAELLQKNRQAQERSRLNVEDRMRPLLQEYRKGPETGPEERRRAA